MLTLDRTTLFYLSYIDPSAETNDKTNEEFVNTWVDAVQAQGHAVPLKTPKPKPPKPKSGSNATRSALTRVTRDSKPTSSSALSNSLHVVSSADQDEDELYGPERDAAMSSPSKGKKRIDSTVNRCIFLSLPDVAELYISLLLWSSVLLSNPL